MLAGKTEQLATSRLHEKLLCATDLSERHRAADLPGDWPTGHGLKSDTGERLPVDLCAGTLAGWCRPGRVVAGLCDFWFALGTGATDDQQSCRTGA